jgi:hypothetical protein
VNLLVEPVETETYHITLAARLPEQERSLSMNNRIIGQNVFRSFIAGVIAVFFYVLFTRIFAGTLNGNTLLWSLLVGGMTVVIAFVISSLFTLYFSRKKDDITN